MTQRKKRTTKKISIRKTPASTWIFDDASIVFFMRLIRVPDLRHQKFHLETGYSNNMQPMTRTDFINRLITCISFFIANVFFSFLSLIVWEKKSIEFFTMELELYNLLWCKQKKNAGNILMQPNANSTATFI